MFTLVRTAGFLLLLVTAVALAQSGRRSAKPATPPAAKSEAPSVGPTKSAVEAPAAVKMKLLVASQHTKKNLPSEEVIFASLIKELSQFRDVAATTIGDLKTDQAVKRAQQEEERYVVLVQFETDGYQSGQIIINSPNLQIHCYVYWPKTGERRVKDKTYYQPMGGTGSRTTVGSGPVKITPEAAGVSVAQQIRSGILLVLGAQSPSLKLP